MKKTPHLLSLEDTTWLKALAILAVVFLHTWSLLPKTLINPHPNFFIFMGLDQLARFCVPLFVFLSGYGLAFSQTARPLDYVSFLKKRAFKLLPLYLLWSVSFFIMSHLQPGQTMAFPDVYFVRQLSLGQADYQLYFVPMIFTLYLFFPLLFQLMKKWKWALLILAVGLQIISFWWFAHHWPFLYSINFLGIDQAQYLWPFSWLGYFVVGMWASSWQKLTINRQVLKVAWVGSLIFVMANAINAVKHMTDPLLAMEFTRWPLLIYAYLSFGVLISSLPQLKKLPTVTKSALTTIGIYSYLIYLCHTWALRIIFTFLNYPASVSQWSAIIVVWVVTTAISIAVVKSGNG